MPETTQAQWGSGKDLQPTLQHFDRAIEAIRQDINQRTEELKEWRQELRNRPDTDDMGMYKQERSFRNGLQRALDYLTHELPE